MTHDYATYGWITGQGYLEAADLAPYATTTWVDSQMSALGGWILDQGYVEPSDLAGYATQAWIDGQGYVTPSWRVEVGYVTVADLPPYEAFTCVDDDGDGATDCQDGDCISDPACASAEACTDGADNDDDGLTDCADPACGGAVAIPGACTNAADEAALPGIGDALTTCQPACIGRPASAPRALRSRA